MLNFGEVMDKRIEQALLATHTAYLARAVRIEGGRVTLQPLTLAKEQHGEPHPQPLVSKAPRLRGVAVQAGDICLCVCCERDISAALRGQMAMPGNWRHALSDAIVVGVVDV